jgi:hypothetical protein
LIPVPAIPATQSLERRRSGDSDCDPLKPIRQVGDADGERTDDENES